MQHRRSRLMKLSGQHAVIEPDGFTDGAFILSIGGAEQSHVDLKHPEHIFYEYLRRIGNIIDVVAPAGERLRVLHLGAGALTLVRYIQATRPGSEQYAVELERELEDFVLKELPLAPGTRLEMHHGDARAQLAAFRKLPKFDVIVLDVFAGPEAPAHLTTPDFYAEAARLLGPAGILVVNVGDDPPLTFARSQVKALQSAVADVAALAQESMFTGRYPGNIILAGGRQAWNPEWTGALLAAGPHPAAVLTGMDLAAFADG